MSLAAPQIERLQAPLVIGVTGHRDLRQHDLPHLEKLVRHVLGRLRERYPSTPLVVLSPLAEGADRLVARAGFAFGARLVVPLPLPAALYEQDFEEPGSVDEFRALLAQAECSFVLPPEPDLAAIRNPGLERDRRYELAGSYVVQQSQIFIALWDGVESGKVGGTSAMVKLRTEGRREARQFELQPLELFPVYHIVTPRRSNPNPAREAFQLREIYPPVFQHGQNGETYYAKALRNLDVFNRTIQDGTLLHEAADSRRGLVREKTPWLSGSLELALEQYAITDALAIRYHRKNVRTHAALHILVFVSFLCFVLFGEWGEFRPWWLFASLLVLAVALVTHRFGRRRAFDDESLDYRAVAEGARVRFFWRMAGVHESVSDNYLEEQRTELDWIRNALRAWDAAAGWPARTEAPENARPPVEFALKHWVEHQHRYFAKAARSNRERGEQIERSVKIAVYLVLAAAIGVAIAALVNSFFNYGWWDEPRREWLKWPLMAIDLLLAIGALSHHFGERMAYSEHSKLYRRMEEVFRSARAMAAERMQADDLDGARAVLLKLGQEALAENGGWVLLHRDRPLELPHP
ncbi:MAG TPA: hypothetical protein VKX49_11630 [Bryobacteraceae bacterium]|nr:hypothetical protein [Bryobacteraceae bacterium]